MRAGGAAQNDAAGFQIAAHLSSGPVALDGPEGQTRRLRFVVASALVSVLPLFIWWRHFARLFFFHDDWELLRGASSDGLIPWLFQPFLGEGFMPLFKLLWIAAVRVSGGGYMAMIVLLWATHFAVLILFGWLLLRLRMSETAAAIAVVTLGLPWSNMETLTWSMQWNAVLAILFLLTAWHLLVEILDGRRWLLWYVLCLLACGLVSTRGIFYGVVLAAFVFTLAVDRLRWRLIAWSLVPSILATGATLLTKQDSAARPLASLSRDLSFAAYELLLNPLYTLISYPGRHVGLLALLLFGAVKAAIFCWAIAVEKKPPVRALLLTLLAFDVLNALALGYGRAYTGDPATVNSRYQYISLLCFGAVLGWAISQFKREAALVFALLWLGLLGYPWKTHLERWAVLRGSDLRMALKTGAPDAHFDPSSLTVAQARALIERYGLH